MPPFWKRCTSIISVHSGQTEVMITNVQKKWGIIIYTTSGKLMSLVLCTGMQKKGSIQKFDQLLTISFFKCYVAVIIVMWNTLFHNTNMMFCVSDWMSFFTTLYVDYLDFHGIILLINLEVDTCSPAHNNWKFLWYQAL